jgi:hypothetical protein
VTVFVVAVEEPARGCAITQTKGAPAPAVTYDDGGRTMARRPGSQLAWRAMHALGLPGHLTQTESVLACCC